MLKQLFNPRILGIALAMSCFTGAYAQTGYIQTIAGSGSAGSTGDGGAATAATLSQPMGVSVNNFGDVFIGYGTTVRKISGATGVISSLSLGSGSLISAAGLWTSSANDLFIADHYADNVMKYTTATGACSRHCGSGHQGTSGDGGQATSCRMEMPKAACTDNAGNVYIADAGGNRIRKVTASTGIVNTICGSITAGYSGDGGPASAALLSWPSGICIDKPGNIYISDNGNARIRKIDAATGIITTIAGTGATGFSGDRYPATNAKISGPLGIFCDRFGNVFFADHNNNRIRKIDASGIINTVAGTSSAGFSGDGGLAVAARMSGPVGVWVDAYDNIYIADQYNNRIRKVTPTAPKPIYGSVETVADVSVIPNPTTGTFILQADAALINNTFEIYNIAGVLVNSGTITDAQNSISLNQPTGIYMLVVRTGSDNIIKRISVTK